MSKKVERNMSIFEKYLTLWVLLCIGVGILIGKVAPGMARFLDSLAIYVNGAPVVSIPIAICLFFMMYPIMVKIDFAEVIKAGKSPKPVGLTLFVNWAIKPFTMYAIAFFFLGVLFKGLIGAEAVDFVKLPPGADWSLGSIHGAGTVVIHEGLKMLQVPLWRSYFAGCIFAVGISFGIHSMAHWFNKVAKFEIYMRRATGAIFILVGIYYILFHINTL